MVVGAIADQVAREINEAMAGGEPAGDAPAALSIDALGQALGAAITAVEARASRVLRLSPNPGRWMSGPCGLRARGRPWRPRPARFNSVIGPAAEQVARRPPRPLSQLDAHCGGAGGCSRAAGGVMGGLSLGGGALAGVASVAGGGAAGSMALVGGEVAGGVESVGAGAAGGSVAAGAAVSAAAG